MKTTLYGLFLESSRRYSEMADVISQDSIQKSQFASRVSGQRMEVAKAIRGGKLDLAITLDDGEMRVMESTDTGWRECLDVDNLIMSVMADNNEFPSRRFTSLLQGVYEDALYCAECLADEYVKYVLFRCLSCGAISNQAGGCPICGSGGNWCVPCEPTPPVQDEDGNPSWWIDISCSNA